MVFSTTNAHHGQRGLTGSAVLSLSALQNTGFLTSSTKIQISKEAAPKIHSLCYPIETEGGITISKAQTRIQISRRELLLGAGAVSILTMAWQSYRHVGSYPKADFPYAALSDREAAILKTLGNWLIPPGGDIPGSGGDDITLQRIDKMLRGVPEQKRFLLSALPLAFEHGTALFAFGGPRMTDMTAETRHEYLQGWAESDNLIQCQLMAAVKTLYGFGYFDREDVLKACGLPYFCGSMT